MIIIEQLSPNPSAAERTLNKVSIQIIKNDPYLCFFTLEGDN